MASGLCRWFLCLVINTVFIITEKKYWKPEINILLYKRNTDYAVTFYGSMDYSCHKMLGKFHSYVGCSGVGMKM